MTVVARRPLFQRADREIGHVSRVLGNIVGQPVNVIRKLALTDGQLVDPSIGRLSCFLELREIRVQRPDVDSKGLDAAVNMNGCNLPRSLAPSL